MVAVLLVEPDRNFAQLVQDHLSGVAECHVVRSAQAAIDWLDTPKHRCDMVITELTLGTHSGVEIIHELRSHSDWSSIPVILHTRVPRMVQLSDQLLEQDYGVIGYIEKGHRSLERLLDIVQTRQHETISN